MILIIIMLPLMSFLTINFYGFKLGKLGSSFISCFNMFIVFIFSWILFLQIIFNKKIIIYDIGSWIICYDINLNWSLLVDSLTVVMLIVVNSISFMVHIYSTEYMKEDPHLPRFMGYLSFFTFAMLILVTANNFVQMFLGWESVGIASYLLISFWYTRTQANKSALKAVLINKIGDFFLFISILLIFYNFKSLNYSTVFATGYLLNDSINYFNIEFNILTCINFFIFLGAFGKSAQIGLHTWLPDAMEGPTPVSALIHAATMVTAGVFLIIRCSPLIEYSNLSLIIISLFGATTAFMSATIGLFQNDIKKIIAYSTCSQLGYMVLICGLSAYSVSLFHLMNHAFFKALLFLCAGSVIHSMADEQDIRKMGGLLELMPITYIMVLIGSLSLAGFPFLTGFYSKDIILEIAYGSYSINGNFSYWLGVIAAFFTSFYSFRLIYFTFLSKNESNRIQTFNIHESPLKMTFSFILLCIGSIFLGFLFKEIFIGIGNITFNNSIFNNTMNINYFESEFLPFYIKLIPVIYSLLGIIVCIYIYKLSNFRAYINYIYQFKYIKVIYIFLVNKWFFDNIYNTYIVKYLLNWGYIITFKTLDRGILEHFGPFGITILINKLSKNINKLQTGFIYNYAFIMVIVFVIILSFILLFNINIFLNLKDYYQIILVSILNFLLFRIKKEKKINYDINI